MNRIGCAKSALYLMMLLFVFNGAAKGTDQISDKLIHKGKTYELSCFPLEVYFDDANPRPEFLKWTSTACWRGYIGTWEFKDGRFFLVKLEREHTHRPKGKEDDWSATEYSLKEVSLSKIFKSKEKSIQATWFSGVVSYSKGEPVWTDSEFRSTLEVDTYFTVKKGKLVSKRIVNNRHDGATLSPTDIYRVEETGGQLKNDDTGWVDAREVFSDAGKGLRTSGMQFRTRGILRKYNGATFEIPETPTTHSVSVNLQAPLKFRKGEYQRFVEIKGRIVRGEKVELLELISVKLLGDGQSIHHPKFKATEEKKRIELSN